MIQELSLFYKFDWNYSGDDYLNIEYVRNISKGVTDGEQLK